MVGRYQIKIVPNDKPNAAGRWIDTVDDEPMPWGWLNTEKMLRHNVPEGYHMVAIRTTLKGESS